MKKNLIGLLTIIIFWLLITFIFNPPSYLFPSLIDTVTDFISNYQLYIHHTFITVIEIVLGFIVALFIGLSLSLVALYYQKTETIFTFISIILKTIPIIAIAPLLVLWFGNGLGSKVAAVAITSFIPIFVNTLSGAKIILNRYKNIIGIYSLNKLEINKIILLHGISEYIITSLKITSSLAVVGALVSEFISANKGLGYLIISNYYSMNIAGVFVCIMISGLLGILIYSGCDYLERRYSYQ